MTRSATTSAVGVMVAGVLLAAVGANAQAIDGQVVDVPPLGAGVVATLRLVDHATGAPVSGARIDSARLFGASGAALPATPLGEVGFGVYAVRIDLPTPGAWTLQATVATPALGEALVSLALNARADAATPTRGDPDASAGGPAEPQAALPAVALPPAPLPPPN